MRRFDVESLPAQRWKNGGGLTREIARGPEGVGPEEFGWRLSVAEVEQPGPFSAFPGVDRCIVVLRGEGMALHDEAGVLVQTLLPLQPWAFAGERALHARLPAGPCQDFNVMTRRGQWRSQLGVVRISARVPRGDVTLLLALRGDWRCGRDRIAPLQGLLLDGPGEAVDLLPEGEGASLLHVQLCHDPQP